MTATAYDSPDRPRLTRTASLTALRPGLARADLVVDTEGYLLISFKER